MQLADISIPPRLSIPERMLAASKTPEIGVSGLEEVPFGADEWIACCYAVPHVDPWFEGELFLTLSIVSSHMAGDARSKEPLSPVPVGRLFVVDPMVSHWLVTEKAWESTRVKPWIGVQWKVSRRNAKASARRIVHSLGGKWRACEDKRYKNWTPTA